NYIASAFNSYIISTSSNYDILAFNHYINPISDSDNEANENILLQNLK
ncbi:2426_t:CDS:1, partial [Cetraspora pellucida]